MGNPLKPEDGEEGDDEDLVDEDDQTAKSSTDLEAANAF